MALCSPADGCKRHDRKCRISPVPDFGKCSNACTKLECNQLRPVGLEMYSGLHNSVASEALSISLSKRDSVSGGGEIKISLEITLMANKQAISEVSIPELGNGCQRPDTKCLDPMHGCGVFRVTKFTLFKNPFKPFPQERLYFKRRKRKRSPQKLSQYKANMRFPKYYACRSNEQSVCVSTLRCPEERQSDKTDYQSESSEPFVEVSHFKTEGIHMLKDLLRPGDFMTKVDLKDAHFMIPIARPQTSESCCVLHGRERCISSTVCRSDYRQSRGFLPRPQGR